MAIFAIFCGSLYNEFFSLPWDLFGSCYSTVKDVAENRWVGELTEGCTYPWGFDPKWFISKNELVFFNSFKMKWAVILGVISMIFGILMKGLNAIYFRDGLVFFLEFIP